MKTLYIEKVRKVAVTVQRLIFFFLEAVAGRPTRDLTSAILKTDRKRENDSFWLVGRARQMDELNQSLFRCAADICLEIDPWHRLQKAP